MKILQDEDSLKKKNIYLQESKSKNETKIRTLEKFEAFDTYGYRKQQIQAKLKSG